MASQVSMVLPRHSLVSGAGSGSVFALQRIRSLAKLIPSFLSLIYFINTALHPILSIALGLIPQSPNYIYLILSWPHYPIIVICNLSSCQLHSSLLISTFLIISTLLTPNISRNILISDLSINCYSACFNARSSLLCTITVLHNLIFTLNLSFPSIYSKQPT